MPLEGILEGIGQPASRQVIHLQLSSTHNLEGQEKEQDNHEEADLE